MSWISDQLGVEEGVEYKNVLNEYSQMINGDIFKNSFLSLLDTKLPQSGSCFLVIYNWIASLTVDIGTERGV